MSHRARPILFLIYNMNKYFVYLKNNVNDKKEIQFLRGKNTTKSKAIKIEKSEALDKRKRGGIFAMHIKSIISLIYKVLFFWMESLSPQAGVQSWLTATSASLVQVILLPHPPE